MKISITIIMALAALNGFPQDQGPQGLFQAVRAGDLTRVKEIVEKDPRLLNARKADQSTPLHEAVDSNNRAVAGYLLAKGADANAVNENGWTPLFYAKNAGMAGLLLDNGSKIIHGPPLTVFVMSGRKEVAEYLIARGAKPPDIGAPESTLFLVRAVQKGSVKILEYYLERGFSPAYESTARNNLLHCASESEAAELIDTLTRLGVSAKKTNIFGWTPLHIAALNGNLQVVKSLVNKDVDINARTPDGKTPLNLAAEAKKDETVAYLKSLGADQRPPIFPELRGDYMGQPKPSKKAVPFAPGILNPRHEYHGAVTVTPDGKEIHWSAYADSGGASIWRSRQVEGRWTEPEFFQRGDVPFISPRGDQFYFVAFKQVQGGKKAVIYIRDKTASGWSEPRELPETINSTPGIHWQISVDRQGNLYFGASGGTSSRIYVSESTGGEYGKPQLIESLKDREAFSPFIAPDGSYLIFTTPEEGENLFLSFKKKDGTWSRGIDLSNVIGVKGAFCPMVTHDGKFLFFVCGVDGKYAHYWADASFIEELRKTETERN